MPTGAVQRHPKERQGAEEARSMDSEAEVPSDPGRAKVQHPREG